MHVFPAFVSLNILLELGEAVGLSHFLNLLLQCVVQSVTIYNFSANVHSCSCDDSALAMIESKVCRFATYPLLPEQISMQSTVSVCGPPRRAFDAIYSVRSPREDVHLALFTLIL